MRASCNDPLSLVTPVDGEFVDSPRNRQFVDSPRNLIGRQDCAGEGVWVDFDS